MTYTIKCTLDDDAFAMMRRAKLFCDGDEKATAHCTDIRDGIEVWTVETKVDIQDRLVYDPNVISYDSKP